MEELNCAFVAKLGWEMSSNSDSMWVSALQEKYCRGRQFLAAPASSGASCGCFTAVQQLLSQHPMWQISWIPRIANVMAHNVAKWGLNSSSVGDFLSTNVPSIIMDCEDT